jgi:hypothetical protein
MASVARKGAADACCSCAVDAHQDRASESRVCFASLGEHSMLDIIMLAIALGFFALSVGYAYACDRL